MNINLSLSAAHPHHPMQDELVLAGAVLCLGGAIVCLAIDLHLAWNRIEALEREVRLRDGLLRHF